MLARAFWTLVVVCAVAVGEGRAQLAVGVGAGVGYPYAFGYGPRVAPPWAYPGLYSLYGPFGPYPAPPGLSTYVYPYPFYNGTPGSFGSLAYDPVGFGPFGYGYGPFAYGGFGYGGFGRYGYPFFPWYSGRAGSSWSNGLSLYSAPVPVPGAVPGLFGNSDLTQLWRTTLSPGYAGPVFVGVSVSRGRYPPGMIRPVLEPFEGAPAPRVPAAKVGGALIISVKVPQPLAEVFLDGKPTLSTGTDRTFQSPPLEAGKPGTFTVTARWVERGRTVEVSRPATGEPGEVVRVDFGR
jgi:uncharacterized protein (TIGR03000 family)